MIVIGIGANLPHPDYGVPRRTCGAAMALLGERGVGIEKLATWYQTAPVLSDTHGAQGEQPWYVNSAAMISTDLGVHELLHTLLDIETVFGRVRSIANAPRTLDLDIITYHNQVLDEEGLNIPHPRMHERAFVLYPLRDLVANWRHPTLNRTIDEMINDLPEDQSFQEMPDADGLYGTEWQENGSPI